MDFFDRLKREAMSSLFLFIGIDMKADIWYYLSAVRNI